MTPVAAIGPTARDVGFPAKGDRASPSVAPFDVELGFVDEPGHAGERTGAGPAALLAWC